jgi:cytochrome P450
MQYLPDWIYPLRNQLRRFGHVLRNFWWVLDSKSAARHEESFSKTLVSSREKEGLPRDEIGEMTANLFGGGVDTTSSTLHTMIPGLCLFPEALKSADVELDTVVGRDRSPRLGRH